MTFLNVREKQQYLLAQHINKKPEKMQKTLKRFLNQNCIECSGKILLFLKDVFCFIRHIAGLNAGRARSIMEWKEKNGPFLNREQLKLVKGIGPKSFQQCAGFIRINPETVRRYTSKSCHFYSYMFLHQAAFISCRGQWDKMSPP